MKPRGYFWCDHCDDGCSGRRCEHCGHDGRFIHVALTAPRANELGWPQTGKVNPERAHALFAQIHQQLDHIKTL